MEEFKVLIDFTENERVLKSLHSVYSRSRNSSIDSYESDTEAEDGSMEESE